MSLILLGGYTGSGKTEILTHLQSKGHQVLNLEALSLHNGSVFGHIPYSTKVSPYQFHKQLVQKWQHFNKSKPIFCESKPPHLGQLRIPIWLLNEMMDAPVIWLETPITMRLERLLALYGHMDTLTFSLALYKLYPHVNEREIKEIFTAYDVGNKEVAFTLLMAYYDKGEYYKKRNSFLIATIEIINWVPESIYDCICRSINEINNVAES